MNNQHSVILSISMGFILMACAGNGAAKVNNTTQAIAPATTTWPAGSGYYYEITTTTKNKQFTVITLLKIFLSPDGKVRTEMTTSGLPGKKDPTPIILIGNASHINQSTELDPVAKTYTVRHIDESELVPDQQLSSEAIKIGSEKIGSYQCVHAQVLSTRHMGPLGNRVDTLQLWKSNDVAMPDAFKKWLELFEKKTGGSMYSLQTVQQLQQMGCTGFTVQLYLNSKTSRMVMQLTKTDRVDFSRDLFEVPAGYTEDKSE